jgi:alpha-ribazole phosphatase
MTLWLVRHAQPLIASGICYGRLDVAADAPATAQCAQALAGLLPPGTRVRSSPLQRCAQLASALHGLRPDLAYKTDPRLQEMDFGQWEGRAWQGIAPAELAAWTDDFADHAVGRSGECVRGFMARVGAVFDSLRGASDTLWITHAGVIRATELLARGVRCPQLASQWTLDAPNYGQWRTLALPTGHANQAKTNST